MCMHLELSTGKADVYFSPKLYETTGAMNKINECTIYVSTVKTLRLYVIQLLQEVEDAELVDTIMLLVVSHVMP